LRKRLGETLAELLVERGKQIEQRQRDRSQARTDHSVRKFHVHPRSVAAIAISLDGKYIASTAGSEVVHWEVDSKTELQKWKVTDATGVGIVQYSPDGRYILGIGDHSGAALWETKSGKTRALISPLGQAYALGAAPAVSLSSKGDLVVLFSNQKGLGLWRMPLSLIDKEIARVDEWIEIGGISEDLGSVHPVVRGSNVSGSQNRKMQSGPFALSRLEKGSFPGPHNEILLSPDGNTLLVMAKVGGEQKLESWDLRTGRVNSIKDGIDDLLPVALSFVGSISFSPQNDLGVPGKLEAHFLAETQSEKFYRYHPSGNMIAIPGFVEGGVQLRSAVTAELIIHLQKGHELGAIAFSADGKWMVTGNSSGYVWIWDLSEFDLGGVDWRVR